MANCEKYSELITELAAGTLPESERTQLEAHIAQCPECTALLAETRELLAVMKNAEFPEPSDDYTQNLADRVFAQTGSFKEQGAQVIRPTFRGSLSRVLATAAALVLLITGFMYLNKNDNMTIVDQPETQKTTIEEQVANILSEQDSSFDTELDAALRELDTSMETDELFHEMLLAKNPVDDEDLEWLAENFDSPETTSESFDTFFDALTDEEVELILENLDTEQEHRTQIPEGVS